MLPNGMLRRKALRGIRVKANGWMTLHNLRRLPESAWMRQGGVCKYLSVFYMAHSRNFIVLRVLLVRFPPGRCIRRVRLAPRGKMRPENPSPAGCNPECDVLYSGKTSFNNSELETEAL